MPTPILFTVWNVAEPVTRETVEFTPRVSVISWTRSDLEEFLKVVRRAIQVGDGAPPLVCGAVPVSTDGRYRLEVMAGTRRAVSEEIELPRTAFFLPDD